MTTSPGASASPATNASEPVGVSIRRRVTPGHEAAFAEAIQGATHAARTFPGYVSSEVLRPPNGAGEWQCLLRFDSPATLRAWEESAVSQGWRTRADGLTAAPQLERVNGLEAWFHLAGQNSLPPKWKTAVIGALGTYPMILFVFPRLAPLMAGLAPWLGSLVSVLLLIPVMTWGVSPLLTRLFSGWLYPANPTSSTHA